MYEGRPAVALSRDEKLEEIACNCGAGYGSNEGHTKWCKWHYVQMELKKLGPNDPLPAELTNPY